MKHLPNLLTLGNLFCGCLAIVYIMNAQPFLSYSSVDGTPTWDWVFGLNQIFTGVLFILGAAVFDMLDGLAARALKVFSPIGKDLDSLADVVSFGVAPAMILFKMLWDATMMEKDAMDASMLSMAPAFLIPCFAALRLAKFNVMSKEHGNTSYFMGMPTPAAGLGIATLPLLMRYNPYGLEEYLKYKWTLYAVIAILCWLMVSNIKFFKLMPAKWKMNYCWPQVVLLAAALIGYAVMNKAAVPFMLFALYIVLSLVYRQPKGDADMATI